MEPQYLKKLEETKEIFIRPLSNYNEKELGSERGDNNEGVLNTELKLTSTYTFGSKENPEFEGAFNALTQGVFSIADGVSITGDGAKFVTKFTRRNFYNYSLCLEYDEKVKKEFGGATLVIDDFPKFLVHLNLKMYKQGTDLAIAQKCKYIKDRKNSFTEKSDNFNLDFPPFVKDERYEYQKEFRLLWRNRDGTDISKPLLVYSPESLQYCTFEY